MANPLANIILNAVDKTQATFRNVNNGLKAMEDRATSINSVFARFLPLLGAATVTSFAKNIIDSADGLKDLSERTGVSISRLAAFDLAAKQNGTSMEALSKALAQGSRSIVQNADELQKLGINAKTSEELIFQLADVIASLPADDPRRVAIAMQFLGRSAGELVPLLSLGGDELRRLAKEGEGAAKVLEQLAPQADEFNDNLAKLQQNSTLVGAKVFLPFIRYFNSYAEEGAKANGITETLWVNLKAAANTATGIALLFSLFDDGAEKVEKAAAATENQRKKTDALSKQLKLLNLQLIEQQQSLAKNQKTQVVDAYKQNVDALKGQIDGFKDLQKAMVSAFDAAGNAAQDAMAKADAFLQRAAQTRQSAQDRITDLELQDASPDDADAVRNQQVLDALGKADYARVQAKYQILLGNTAEADKQLEIAEREAQRADEITGKLHDEGLARQRILDAAEQLAQVDEARAALQKSIAQQETQRQESLKQQMSANDGRIADLTTRLEELNAKVKELSNTEANIKISSDQEAIDKTLADIANVKTQLADLSKGVTVPVRMVSNAGPGLDPALQIGSTDQFGIPSPFPQFAVGGGVRGPGSGTSDSILARLSNGEHVLTAREVMAAGGHSAIYRLRRALLDGKLPQFANGGAVMRASIPSLPSIGSGSGSSSGGLDRGTFVLPSGDRVEFRASPKSFDTLERGLRLEALKRGGRK